MLSDKLQDALNEQLNAETYSAYLYMAMGAWFKSVSLDGFASWMHVQAQEELMHANKFYDFINQRGGRVALMQIDAPQVEWDTPMAVFEATLAHEQHVTSLINDLMNMAIEEKDHATQIFLQWFVSEQVEEEETAGGILEQLKLLENATGGLFMIDRELGSRPPLVTWPAEDGD